MKVLDGTTTATMRNKKKVNNKNAKNDAFFGHDEEMMNTTTVVGKNKKKIVDHHKEEPEEVQLERVDEAPERGTPRRSNKEKSRRRMNCSDYYLTRETQHPGGSRNPNSDLDMLFSEVESLLLAERDTWLSYFGCSQDYDVRDDYTILSVIDEDDEEGDDEQSSTMDVFSRCIDLVSRQYPDLVSEIKGSFFPIEEEEEKILMAKTLHLSS